MTKRTSAKTSTVAAPTPFSAESLAELYRKAQRHLSRSDAILKQMIATVGPCTLQPNPDHFATLARSIVAQQISSKAAMSISARLLESLPGKVLTAPAVLATPEQKLREAGLSAGKLKALRDLATKVHDGTVPLADLHARPDDEVVRLLVPVYGIGPWTAQMFLIFSLGRTDVLPVLDYGLREGARRFWGLRKLPTAKRLEQLAKPWAPYRSIATWYVWRSLGPVPES